MGVVLLSLPVTITAQETEPPAEETAATPDGVSTLMFLLGAGAIVVVGGAMLARDNFRSEQNE
jgi:hypothetical protein